MRKKDLHDKFIEELHKRNSKRAELINQVSDILKLEKESVYREWQVKSTSPSGKWAYWPRF